MTAGKWQRWRILHAGIKARGDWAQLGRGQRTAWSNVQSSYGKRVPLTEHA